ncbi:MAG TPA: hypothetical protein VLE91_00630 [Candidatus Saccharimonadales bacterium]|nr:hypothetical protein [Candidatus Saccharimonadales bacterium]
MSAETITRSFEVTNSESGITLTTHTHTTTSQEFSTIQQAINRKAFESDLLVTSGALVWILGVWQTIDSAMDLSIDPKDLVPVLAGVLITKIGSHLWGKGWIADEQSGELKKLMTTIPTA